MNSKTIKKIIILLVVFSLSILGAIVFLSINKNDETINNERENIIEIKDFVYDYNYQNIRPKNLSDEELMNRYLQNYSYNILNNTEVAYKLLNKEYSNIRFNTFEEFEKFVEEKKEQLQNIEVRQYNAYEEDDYYIFECTDENGNYYKIKELEYMQYEMILDDYTLQEDYSDISDEEKIEKDVEIFISMINSANYSGAYSLLELTFKEINFQTEADFINYIKSNWFKRNIITTTKITETGTCKVVMQETIATTSNKIEKEFMVILGEGMDFAIRFNI